MTPTQQAAMRVAIDAFQSTNIERHVAAIGALRAALAEPVVEPVAFLHDDGYWTAAKTHAGRALNDKLHFAGSTKVAVFTSPPSSEVPLLPDVCPFCEAGKTYSIRKCRACGSESVPGWLHDQNADEMQQTATQQAQQNPVLFIHPDTFAKASAHVGAWKPGHELPGSIPLYTHPKPDPQQDPDALHLAAMDLARKQADRIAELEAEAERFRQHALNEKAARQALEQQLAARVLRQADMFWNSDDAETPHDSIECFLNDRICNDGLEVGAVFTMFRAKKLPDVTIRVTSIDAEQSEAEYKVIEAAHGITKENP